MKLAVKEISVSPPGTRTRKGIGWSEVFVHLHDNDADILPSVTVKVHVPYQPDDSFQSGRERALERAQAIIQFALESLQNTNLRELDAANQD